MCWCCYCHHQLTSVYREQESSTPETLPRLKRLLTGRHSSHRIQRSASLRVHKSQASANGVRSFATQSFSSADKRMVDRAATPIIVTTQRFVSISH